MVLLVENKGKVMDNYSFILKFTVSKTGLNMLCHVALIWTIYCITKLFTVLPREVSWFVPSLSLSQLCQPEHKKQCIEKLLSNSEYGISKTKDKFLNTKVIIFFINSKTRCTYFNPLMSGGRKRSNILKKTTAKSCCLF